MTLQVMHVCVCCVRACAITVVPSRLPSFITSVVVKTVWKK